MARIRTYTPELQQAPVNVSAASQGAASAQAMQGLGNQITNLGERMTQIQTARDLSKMSADFATSQADLTNQFRDVISQADPNDPNVATNFLNDVVKPRIEKIAESANTPEAKLHYQEQAAQLNAHFNEVAAAGQHELAGIAAAQNHNTIMNATTSMLTTAPQQFDAAIQQLDMNREALVKSGMLTRAQAIQAKANDNATATEAAVDGWIEQKNPEKAVDYLKGGIYDEYIDGVTKARLLAKAEDALRGQKDQTRGLLRLQFADDMAQMAATGYSASHQWTEVDARAIAEVDAKGNVDQVQAQQLVNALNSANAQGSERRRSLITPLTEDAKRIADMMSGLKGQQDFGTEADRVQVAQQVYAAKVDAFQKDPVSYTMKASPYTQKAFDDFVAKPSPERYQEFVTMSAADQRRIAPGISPSVLPGSVIADIGNTMSQVGQDGGPEAAAKKLAQWQGLTGSYWPQAVRDLYAAHALTPSQYVAAGIMGSSNVSAMPRAADLIRADAMKDEDLAKLSGGGDVRTRATQAAISALEPMRTSLMAAPGGDQIYNAQVESLSKLLMYYGAGKHQLPSNAKQLATQMFLSDYKFRGHMRIPSSLDVDSVVQGTRVATRNLGQLDIVKPASAYNQDDYVERVRANGFWITNSDETGAKLVDDIGRPVIERRNGVPTQVERTWQDLISSAHQPRGTGTPLMQQGAAQPGGYRGR